MQRFLARRFVYTIFTLIAATAIVFGLSRAAGDPLLLYVHEGGYGMSQESRDALSKRLGLDRPLPVQYIVWLGNVLRGDMGESILDRKPVATIVREKAGATFQLGLAAWAFATVIGVPLGILSAVKRSTVWDYSGRLFALFGQATPTFWFGIVAILIFAVWLGWVPAATRGDGFSWRHFILPTITLGLNPTAAYLRLTRSAMLEVLESEFVKLAKAKGVSSQSVIWKHALRNALIPAITVSALVMAGFITGAVVVEAVFAWPGLGLMAVQAINTNDFPLLAGAVLMFAVIYVATTFVADITYVLVDPRIRYD